MGRVLVVDDKASNRELLRTALEYAGHEVLEASDGTGAIASLKAFLPDLMLLDIQMPGLDGYAVLERVMADEQLKRIPVIAVTAYAMTADREKGAKAGFKEYITKPIPMKLLLDAVNRQLKGE